MGRLSHVHETLYCMYCERTCTIALPDSETDVAERQLWDFGSRAEAEAAGWRTVRNFREHPTKGILHLAVELHVCAECKPKLMHRAS